MEPLRSRINGFPGVFLKNFPFGLRNESKFSDGLEKIALIFREEKRTEGDRQ